MHIQLHRILVYMYINWLHKYLLHDNQNDRTRLSELNVSSLCPIIFRDPTRSGNDNKLLPYFWKHSFMSWLLSHRPRSISHMDGLAHERRNSIANALELRFSCTNSSIYRLQKGSLRLIWCSKCTQIIMRIYANHHCNLNECVGDFA